MYAYENKDADARRCVTKADYERVCSWMEARETSEVIDPVPTEEPPKPAPKAGDHDPAVAAVTQNLENKEKPEREETRQEDYARKTRCCLSVWDRCRDRFQINGNGCRDGFQINGNGFQNGCRDGF